MIKEKVKVEILKRLRNTEKNEGVRILMAIESGSRAWGFASPNSDYDVRFIYVRNKDWYLAVDLEEKRDIIEYPVVDEIDLNGWAGLIKTINKKNSVSSSINKLARNVRLVFDYLRRTENSKKIII